MSEVRYSVNGKYFKDFGVYISASDGLFDALKRKPVITYDWAEYHGSSPDLSNPKFEQREITLKGFVTGENWELMKSNFDTIISEFQKAGTQRLLIEPFGLKALPYEVCMIDEAKLQKDFKDGQMVGVFTLKLIEPNPVKKVLCFTKDTLDLSYTCTTETEIFYGNGLKEIGITNVNFTNKNIPYHFSTDIGGTADNYFGQDIKERLSGRKSVLVEFQAKSTSTVDSEGVCYLASERGVSSNVVTIFLKQEYSTFYALLEIDGNLSTSSYINFSVYLPLSGFEIQNIKYYNVYPYKNGDNLATNTVGTGNSYVPFPLFGQLAAYVGKKVTLSFDIKVSENANVMVYPYQYRGRNIASAETVSATTEWKHFSFTRSVVDFGYASSGTTASEIGFYSNLVDIEVKNFKIELGESETLFTISPRLIRYLIIAGNIENIANLTTNADVLWDKL